MLPGPPIRSRVRLALDLTRLADIDVAYAELAARPLVDVADLREWLRAWSELESLLGEDLVRRGIAAAAAADDPVAHAAHLDFVERIAPHCEPLRRALARRLGEHPHAPDLEPGEHARVRRTLADLAAARPDPELAAEEQRLVAASLRLRAAPIAADGELRPPAVLEAALDDPDRDRREHAWRQLSARHAHDAPAYEALADRLLAVRQARADAAGFADVRAHQFHLLARRDYDVADCLALHAAIEAEVVPLADELLAERRDRLGLASLRPWDLLAPLGPADLTRPFADQPALVDGLTRALAAVDPAFGRQLAELDRRGLLDLMARTGKAPGASQSSLEASRLPFVFASAVGRREDLWTVLHEFGHALHALACADEPLLWNRRPPREFAELAGIAMELLAGAHLHAFFPEPARRAAVREQLVQSVLFLAHTACIDAFEHWLYTDPRAAAWPGARDVVFDELHRRHFPSVDWTDLEPARARQWHRQSHLFLAPFYSFEYAVAQLGALQLHERHAADPRAAVAAYRDALALGGRVGLRDLFAAAGLRLDFTRDHVARRMAHVRRALARLA